MPSYIHFSPAKPALSLAAPEDMVRQFELHSHGMVNVVMGAVIAIVFLEFGADRGRGYAGKLRGPFKIISILTISGLGIYPEG
jgi:uncharacterized membrane protein